MSGKLRAAWYCADIECLGKGKRFAVWVQGCEKRCKGCIAPSLQDMDGGTLIDTDTLAAEIVNSKPDGITISGGEPFLQADALAELVRKVRESMPDISVIVYTGYIYEALPDNELIKETDLLIDGEYIKALDDGKAMRGSSNQRLIFLTDRLCTDDMPHKRTNKIVFTEKGFRMIGIPSKGAKELLDIMQNASQEDS